MILFIKTLLFYNRITIRSKEMQRIWLIDRMDDNMNKDKVKHGN